MSGYPPPPGNSNYPPLSQIHPSLQAHAPGQNPGGGGGEIAHSQSQHPPASQPYTYNTQPAPQLQLSYANPQTNGNGNLHGNAQSQQSVPAPVTASGDGAQPQKANRLRKACDSCSIRKVKCDDSTPCRPCVGLSIPCTFDRPSRRRGPPNLHAERIKAEAESKKRRLDGSLGNNAVGFDSPGFASPSSPNNIAETLASFSSHAVLNAESICPLPVLELLVDDYFTYLHPLCPFPHEPTFRKSFRSREDLRNPQFLALLASMVGALVASFPRKPLLHLKAQQRDHLFPGSMSLINRCHKVSVEARGAGYLDKDLTILDAATSYLLGLSGAYTFQWKGARLYFAETLAIMRQVGAHKSNNQGAQSEGTLSAAYGGPQQLNFFEGQQRVNYIEQEIGRRVFWVMFVSIRSMQQYGALYGELLIPPPTRSEPYPPLPLEIDDEYIYTDHIDPQPAGVISKLVAYNLNIKIYDTVTPLATMELAYGIDEVFDWNKQMKIIEDCLRSVKQVLESAPRELLLHADHRVAQMGPAHNQHHYPAITDHRFGSPSNGDTQWASPYPDTRRQLQFEVQKANIYASQLATRSYLIEKYWSLHDAKVQTSPRVIDTGLDGTNPRSNSASDYGDVETQVKEERESVVHDLLVLLRTISQENMEPNGASFHNKIRQIASTLIDSPLDRKGPMVVKSEDYLVKFLTVLTKLEKTNRDFEPGTNISEEEELANWADLREYQMRFAQAGGFLG